MASNSHSKSLQLIIKWPGGKWAPQSLRWFSVGKGCPGSNCCPKLRSLIILECCSQLKGKWRERMRLIAAVMQASCKSDVLKRELSVKEKLFTYRWTCLASKLWIGTEWTWYKWWKWDCSEIQWETQLLSQERHWVESLRKNARWGGLGASLGCPPDASEVSVLGMFPRVDPAHTGEIISFSWLGNTLMSLWQNWRWWLGLLGLLPLQPGPKYVANK